jgi:hypothetical protein
MQKIVHILLYELQSIVEREGLGHDERSEFDKMSCETSVTCFFSISASLI